MKKFFWEDKTGRGFTSRLNLKDLLAMENEEDWNSNELHDWAENAEEGDIWENAESEFTCISEYKTTYKGKQVDAISFGSVNYQPIAFGVGG